MGIVRRGDIVSIATQGDFGKPRPALVIQSDLFSAHPSVSVLPITSFLIDAPLLRITLEPNEFNGLKKKSQVMIDKIITVVREKVGGQIGSLDFATMQEIDRCLAVFLGIVR
ncbi:type II toxin-antitoxin system PemK/MazF family toxin [Paenalcaligenes faecalis]|uniref:type II toxin-antitoxin system PemK/MazF family toxin n=1 Tax=Paenalcaligenes faecalis TaxID=2980099 RepID=UPI0022B9A423|nr:type II toxin-antitoxin system PemK/MazF family toxin [Paenalcaligenes faecalis]